MKQSYKKKSKTSFTQLFPIAFFISFIPFIIYLKIVKFDMSIFEWFSDASVFSDFFTYYKSVAVIIIGVVTVLIYINHLLTSKYINFEMHRFYYPLIAYFAFMLLSWIFSYYTYTATFGFKERYEGGFVLMSYLFMFFYITQVVAKESDVKRIFKVFIGAIVLMNVLGLLQYFKLDFMRVEFIQKLVLPKAYEGGTLNFAVQPGRVYMTLYHPNYVGLYIALIFPLVFTFFLCEKGWKKKILWGLLSLVILINLVGSESRGGIIGIVVADVMALVFLRKKIFTYWKLIIPALFIFFGIFFAMDSRSDNYYSERLINTALEAFDEPIDYHLDSIVTDGKSLYIDYLNDPITITYEDEFNPDTLTFLNKDNDVIEASNEAGIFKLGNDTYSSSSFQYFIYEGMSYLKWSTKNASEWVFALTEDGFKYMNPYGKLVDLEPVPSVGFEGKERMGSARGYIWSRSIPLLKDNIFIGAGPDTYIYEFPQNDYVGKYNAYNTQNMVVDKPHNIFLQIATNTGILSLIAMLVFWVMYIISCFKLYFNNDLDDFLSISGVALFLGVCGYLGSGMFNDANVSISPIYWGMIGLGFAVNNMIKKAQGI